jgi:heme/copper-type cytochrome/quinol oxidase subunit 3
MMATEKKTLLTDRNTLGMLCFIASEATFFTLLILAYVYYHVVANNGPTAAGSLDPVKTGIYSLFLLSSSVTIWQAGKSLERQRRGAAIGWLVATVILGGVFLFGQGQEYLHLLNSDVTISRNLFGTTFFTLTGFHGLHVFAGLVAITVLAGLGATGAFHGPRSSAVETVSLYWHFVDVVWVIIFSVIYLWAFV